MNVLGVIVARGGSQGVPNKNLKTINAKPLIQYTIEAAQKSKYLSHTLVSTDSSKISDFAKGVGANVPFLRPEKLADNVISPIYSVLHAKEFYENKGNKVDAVMMLQPTAPFRSSHDIDGSIELLKKTGSDSVISVVDVGATHPARMKYIENGKLIDPDFCEDYENQRRQELKKMYIRNGSIYLTKSKIIEKESFKGNDCRAWIMSSDRSINIDTIDDFLYAEWILKTKKIDQ
jgi:CMP-N-acetylneuraminic acid synthetase